MVVSVQDNKLKFLEGIRGIAALIVVFGHLLGFFYMAILTGHSTGAIYNLIGNISCTPINLLYNGSFSVCMFFVLSGFVLSYKYFITGNQIILAENSVKRYVRLVIPVFFSILLTALYLIISSPENLKELNTITHSGNWLTQQFIVKPHIGTLLNSGLLNVFFKGDNAYGAVLWTMNIEFLGSLLLFAVLSTLHYSTYKNSLLFIVMIILMFAKFYYYSAFFGGALICRQYLARNNKFNHVLITIVLLAIGLYFGSYPSMGNEFITTSIYAPIDCTGYPYYIDFYHVLGSMLILLSVIRYKALMSFFSLRMFTFLGKISFSIYLIHLLAFSAIATPIFKYLYFSGTSYKNSFILSMVITIPALFLSSWLMYLFIDKKAVTLSNKFGKFIINSSGNQMPDINPGK